MQTGQIRRKENNVDCAQSYRRSVFHDSADIPDEQRAPGRRVLPGSYCADCMHGVSIKTEPVSCSAFTAGDTAADQTRQRRLWKPGRSGHMRSVFRSGICGSDQAAVYRYHRSMRDDHQREHLQTGRRRSVQDQAGRPDSRGTDGVLPRVHFSYFHANHTNHESSCSIRCSDPPGITDMQGARCCR